MIIPFGSASPKLAGDAFVAEGAQIIGNVTLCEGSSVWFNAVLRGDADAIVVGRGSNVQDNCVVHASTGIPVTIGENVTVGHSVILHGTTVEDGCLIGMGAVLMNRSVIGAGSLVAAGSLVTEGKTFPPNSMIMGRPAKAVRQLTDEEREYVRNAAAHYVEWSKGYGEA